MALSRTRSRTESSAAFINTAAFVTGTFTPANNSILVVRISGITENGDAMSSADLTISGGGLSWTSRVASQTTVPGWTYGDRVWTAEVSTGSSMTITADCGAFNIHSYTVEVDNFTGQHATAYTGATASTTDSDGAGTGSITLSGAPASTSALMAYVQAVTSGTAVTITEGSGWTEIAESTIASYCTVQSETLTGTTSTSHTAWANLAATGNALGASMIALEIIEAGGGGGAVTVKALSALGVG